MRPDSHPRLWRYINPLLTYLLRPFYRLRILLSPSLLPRYYRCPLYRAALYVVRVNDCFPLMTS